MASQNSFPKQFVEAIVRSTFLMVFFSIRKIVQIRNIIVS